MNLTQQLVVCHKRHNGEFSDSVMLVLKNRAIDFLPEFTLWGLGEKKMFLRKERIRIMRTYYQNISPHMLVNSKEANDDFPEIN